MISEDDFPNKEIIESIINATSIKYKIKLDDMNNGQVVVDCLITEIFASNFISVDRKLINSNSLLKIKKEYHADLNSEGHYKHIYEMKSSSVGANILSIFLFICAFTLLVSLFFSEGEKNLVDISKPEDIPIIFGAAISVVVFSLGIGIYVTRIMRGKDKDGDDNMNDSKNFRSILKKFFA